MQRINSPRTDDDAVEQLIKAKGLVAPRVTADDLKANIAHVEYVKHISAGGQVLRWAVITTRNGFAVTGRPSASVSSENDDQEIGQRTAFENAKNELWPLMGFELKSKLALIPGGLDAAAREGMTVHIGSKAIRAKPMTRQAYNDLRGWKLPTFENGDDAGYLVEYLDGGQANVGGFEGYVSWSPAEVFDRAYGKPLA